MSELPESWSESPLENLFEFVIGGDWGKASDFDDHDFVEALCIRGSEIKNWKVDKGETALLRKIKKSSLETRKLKLGDIIVEISGGGPDQPVGRTVLIDEDVLRKNPEIEKVCTNFLRLTRPNDLIDSKYLNYYLQKFYNTGEVTKYQGGSNNLRNLKFKEYITIPVPVAPLNEQIRIANKLDSLLAKVDAAQARLDKIPTLLKRFRQSVLAAATSGELTREWREKNEINIVHIDGLDEMSDAYGVWSASTINQIPKTWSYCKIYQAGKIQGGGTPAKSKEEYWNGDIPWVTPKDMKVNFVNNSKIKITKIGEKESSAKLIEAGAILFVVRGMILQHSFPVAMNTAMVTVNQDMKCITPHEFLLSNYLLYALQSLKGLFVSIAGSSTHGTKRLETKIYQNVAIPIPPLEEQKEIVRRVESLFTLADTVEKQYREAKQRTQRLTQSILAKAFKGELVPQDPNDEPAAELLTRIQAEREAQQPVKKTRKNKKKAKG